MKSDTERAIDVLKSAAGILVRAGWCQGQYSDHGSFCTMGALGMALTGNPSRSKGSTPQTENLYHRIITLLSYRIEPGTSIAAWNDTSGRTAQEVIDHLRATADALENGEEVLPEGLLRIIKGETEL